MRLSCCSPCLAIVLACGGGGAPAPTQPRAEPTATATAPAVTPTTAAAPAPALSFPDTFPPGTSLRIVRWSHFVPRYDKWFDQYAAVGKRREGSPP
ncbi:MAG: hypothetical protein HY681_10630 [Chloroflexi bacterium]|nr:hypothetical protein [Chloroflexota bacterium]